VRCAARKQTCRQSGFGGTCSDRGLFGSRFVEDPVAKRKEKKRNDEQDEKDEQILGSSGRDAPAVSMLD
jgi:hypothetical protein